MQRWRAKPSLLQSVAPARHETSGNVAESHHAPPLTVRACARTTGKCRALPEGEGRRAVGGGVPPWRWLWPTKPTPWVESTTARGTLGPIYGPQWVKAQCLPKRECRSREPSAVPHSGERGAAGRGLTPLGTNPKYCSEPVGIDGMRRSGERHRTPATSADATFEWTRPCFKSLHRPSVTEPQSSSRRSPVPSWR